MSKTDLAVFLTAQAEVLPQAFLSQGLALPVLIAPAVQARTPSPLCTAVSPFSDTTPDT